MEDGTNVLGLIHNLLVVSIPVLSPILTDLLKRMITKIPANLLPIVSTLVGALIAMLSNGFDPTVAAIGGSAGLMGVGVREVVNQNFTKKLAKNRIGGSK